MQHLGQEADAETVRQITEFNAQYESYNKKDIYGSELLSLANKIVDYNNRESDAKGYLKMKGTVNLITTWSSITVPIKTKKQVDLADIVKEKDSIENNLTKKAEKIAEYSEKADYLASLTTMKLNKYLDGKYTSTTKKEEIKKLVQEYATYSTLETEFKRKMFKCTNIKYDTKTGRIVQLDFEEIDIPGSTVK